MPLVTLTFGPERPNAGGAPALQHPTDRVARAGSGREESLPATTRLGVVRDSRLLCILDVDNLDYSAKPRGLRVRYGDLLVRLRQLARVVFPVAVLTSEIDRRERAEALRRVGWRPVVIPREVAVTHQGVHKTANADCDLCFELGRLLGIADATAVLLGTGDGDLAISCARGVRRTSSTRRIPVHTLSVAGATSSRLRTRHDHFSSSTLLGRDLVESLGRGGGGANTGNGGHHAVE